MPTKARVLAPLRPWLRERRPPALPPLRAAGQQPPGPGASGSDSEGEPDQEVLSESELEEEGGPAAARRRREGGPPATWRRRVLQMPLEAAATLSKEDAHYLEKRGRSRWWKRAQFPRVPDEGRVAPPELQVGRWAGRRRWGLSPTMPNSWAQGVASVSTVAVCQCSGHSSPYGIMFCMTVGTASMHPSYEL